MIRILHTADWQIGMRAAHAGARAAEVRQARLTSAERVVALAGSLGAHALVLAGDTFEDNSVEPVLIRRVAELLARAACPVLVLPGNHDPLGPGSVYHHPAWREAAPRVRVLTDETPIELEGAVLLPAPCRAKFSTEDPTRALARPEFAGRIRIGVAHGSLRGQGFEPNADDFPIAADAAERAGLDYLALGHWHSTLVLPSLSAARLAYSGTHEPTKFGERQSGHALLVTLDAPGRPAKVEIHDTATLRFVDRQVTLHADEELARLRAELDALEAPERILFRLQLDGLLSREGFDALDDLEEAARARFLLARIERDRVEPRPDEKEAWLAALPDGVARSIAERLLAESDPARQRVARAALSRLVAMARRAQAS
ncbi:MAG TPA: DNA repair exonuclease [Polyangia bacterium]